MPGKKKHGPRGVRKSKRRHANKRYDAIRRRNPGYSKAKAARIAKGGLTRAGRSAMARKAWRTRKRRGRTGRRRRRR